MRTSSTAVVDIHQHLWPAEFIEALRALPRTSDIRLLGWTLHLPGEPDYAVNPADHDVPARLRSAADCDTVVLGMSSALGIETMDPELSETLLQAWEDGVAGLPAPFRPWASINLVAPDFAVLRRRLSRSVGLQVPATSLAGPAAVARLAPVLAVAQELDKPVFVHPGPAPRSEETLPVWWPAVVDYATQMHAAWWAWAAVGRSLLPRLRICFAAGAGLAPVHHERHAQRGGQSLVVDPLTFVDTSSYGRQGQDSLIRVLGIDPIVFGSDSPYAVPIDLDLGPAATHAVRVANPHRLLEGGQP